MVELNDKVVRGYLMSLVGEDGLKMIEGMPEGEVTDEEIAAKTGVLLNTVRRTLFILYENKFAVCRKGERFKQRMVDISLAPAVF